MKPFLKKFVSVLLTVTILTVFFVPVAFAQGETPPGTVLDKILAVLSGFGSLAGIAAAIAALVNVFKTLKIVTNGTAGKWFAGLNLVAISGLIYLKIFQPQILVETIDAQAAVFAQITLIVLGYIVQLGVGTWAHGILSTLRLPWIGKSFSLSRYETPAKVLKA